MPKGRKPKPRALRVLGGNAGKRALPPDLNAPMPDGVPPPPDGMPPYAVEEWQNLAPKLYDLGLLAEIYLRAFEVYCRVFARWMEAEDKIQQYGTVIKSPKNGMPLMSPYVQIANRCIKQMKEYLVEFGLTPSSSTKIRVDARPQKTSAWDEIDAL